MPKLWQYDSSWDEGKKNLWDEKYRQWRNRDWMDWLETILSFPFEVVRTEDIDQVHWGRISADEPFRLGHRMKAVELSGEDDLFGVIVKVREGRRTAHLPLADLEVASRDDRNFWPVREYTVWFANRCR